MRRSVLLTVALVAVLALAGCAGGSGPAASNNTTNATTTAAPNATDAAYAPGTNASGVVDAPSLSTAYADAAKANSYTVSKNYTAVYANGTTYVQSTLDGDVANTTNYNLTAATSGAAAADGYTTYYTPAGSGDVYTHTVTGGNESFGVDSASPQKRFAKLGVVDNDFVYLTFASADQTSASLENGTTHLSASGFTVTTHHGLTNAADTQATAVVESDGTLDSLTVSYTASANGQPVHVTRTWTYDTGDVTVYPPKWTAVAQATQ